MAKAAKKAKLDKNGLTALGLDKLIELALDEAALNPSFKKRLNAALAGIGGGAGIAKLVDTRLTTLEKATSRIRWQKERAFGNDLESISASIIKEFGAVDPGMALERLIRFVLGYDGIAERANDSSGRIAGIYAQACEAASDLAQRASAEQQAHIASLITPALSGMDYHGFRTLLAVRIAAGLSPEVLKAWDAALAPVMKIPASATLLPAVVPVRRAIVDALGDLDAYVAIEEALPDALRDPVVVADRLHEAGRFADALAWIRRPRKSRVGFVRRSELINGAPKPLPDRDRLEAAILEGMKDRPAAQALRWKIFGQALDVEILREYIAKAGDFEEFEALDRAFAFVEDYREPHAALRFYLAWPRLDLAARYVIRRWGVWEGEFYEFLLPAAEAFEADYPAAATALYRALLERIVGRGLLEFYGTGADYLVRLAALAARPGGNDGLMPHEDYVADLKRRHARRYGFWDKVATAPSKAPGHKGLSGNR
ncbi:MULTISPECIES: DUF6880 family protein [unclassified Rhizobium]|uniref:DUF6880 family protein n=1 Tax=unclassified Rhizobium TaxID=2613769 RepID=UPI0007138B59|nr:MULTISPECIES: DUF6880 family protein [unclassified Rhizobium]KQS91154.1 hypothetical protein ASG42_11780 [Rhizobium sp. Leaf391]KQS96156.1 hypothetical protein ASG50_03530 [Rhizobium sp. Leaf386]KQU09769.1 hypothetical protein ASG68_01845 [Rhizobium sp. Leaf453]